MTNAESNFTDFDAMTLKEKVRELNLDPNTMDFVQFMCAFCTVRYKHLKKACEENGDTWGEDEYTYKIEAMRDFKGVLNKFIELQE